MDNIFSTVLFHSKIRDEIPGFEIRKLFEDKEESPRNIMLDLDSKESAEQRRKQEAKGLKILTPQQMLSRLPISLAQLKAEKFRET